MINERQGKIQIQGIWGFFDCPMKSQSTKNSPHLFSSDHVLDIIVGILCLPHTTSHTARHYNNLKQDLKKLKSPFCRDMLTI